MFGQCDSAYAVNLTYVEYKPTNYVTVLGKKDQLGQTLEKCFPLQGERALSLYFGVFKNEIERWGDRTTTDLSRL